MTQRLINSPIANAQASEPDMRFRSACATWLLAFAVAAVPVSAFAASDTAAGDKSESAGSMMQNSATSDTTHDVMRASEQGADEATDAAGTPADTHDAKTMSHDAMKATKEGAGDTRSTADDAVKAQAGDGMKDATPADEAAQTGRDQATGAAAAINAAPMAGVGESFVTEQGADEILADELSDAEVVTGDDKNIGEVEDILIGSDHRIRALVVEVGGFLGMGQKEVAVNIDRFQHSRGEDGKLRLKLQATVDELKAAQKFVPRKERKG